MTQKPKKNNGFGIKYEKYYFFTILSKTEPRRFPKPNSSVQVKSNSKFVA